MWQTLTRINKLCMLWARLCIIQWWWAGHLFKLWSLRVIILGTSRLDRRQLWPIARWMWSWNLDLEPENSWLEENFRERGQRTTERMQKAVQIYMCVHTHTHTHTHIGWGEDKGFFPGTSAHFPSDSPLILIEGWWTKRDGGYRDDQWSLPGFSINVLPWFSRGTEQPGPVRKQHVPVRGACNGP